MGVAKQQLQAKRHVIANILGSIPKLTAKLTPIGVKRIAQALLLKIFVNKATTIKKVERIIMGDESPRELIIKLDINDAAPVRLIAVPNAKVVPTIK